VAFLPDGTLIAGDDSGTAFWDTATGKIIATMPGPGGEAHGPVSVAFGPRGTFAACAIRNCYLWDITFYRHS
jgi:hypothetical protein